MYAHFRQFIHNEAGAITVDWTVLSAAALGLAIATSGVLNDSIALVSGRMDNELRTRQMSDEWINFLPVHFEDLLQLGLPENVASEVFSTADEMMNHNIMTALSGITMLTTPTFIIENIPSTIPFAPLNWSRSAATTIPITIIPIQIQFSIRSSNDRNLMGGNWFI